jgi:hypothetical protein
MTKAASVAVGGSQGGGLLGSLMTSKVGFGMAALLCIALFQLGSPALSGEGDPDFWWHLLYAKWMLEHQAVPTTDFISWTFNGTPYLLTQWAGQLVLGLSYMAGGGLGTSLLTLACVVGVMVLAARICQLEFGDRNVAMLVALGSTTVFWSTYGRPQMFSFLCLAGIVLLVEKTRNRAWTTKEVAILGAVMMAWVNLHGSYVVGLIYVGLVAVAQTAGGLLERGRFGDALPIARRYALPLAVAIAATLINPNGWKAWLYVIEIAGLQSTTTGIISEWAPTSFGTGAGSTYMLTLLAIALAMASARKRPAMSDLVVFAGMAVFGLMAGRQTLYATLCLLPVLARALASTKLFELVINSSAQLQVKTVWVALAACLIAAAGQAYNPMRAQMLVAWQKQLFPVEAVAFLEREKVQGKFFNEVTSGGYLAFHTGRPIFVDGRMDLYKDKFFFEWFFARMGAPNWEAFVQSSGAEVFVLQRTSAVTQLLRQGGSHAVVHADHSHVVLVPKTDQYAALIAKSKVQMPEFKLFNEKGKLLVAGPMGF